MKGKPIAAHFAQGLEPVLLEADLVIVVDVIDADNTVPAREELAGEREADEPGGAGYEDAHGGGLARRGGGSRGGISSEGRLGLPKGATPKLAIKPYSRTMTILDCG